MSTNANVNKPTNTKVKEADVNRKLQVYGIISAFQHGKVPSVRSYLSCIICASLTIHPSTERPDRRRPQQLLGFSHLH